MKKQSKVIIGITAGVMLIAVVVIVAVLMVSGNDSKKYARHMESAQRYMDELDYEQAIAEYKAAIEIEPNNAEAYRALAELYVQIGYYESAIAVLNQGIEQTGSEELSEYIEEVQMVYEEQKALAEVSAQEESAVKEPQEPEAQQETQDLEEIAEGNGAREEIEYFDSGSDRVREYDENGNCVKETNYNADGTPFTMRAYDENGNCIESIQYSNTGTILFHNVYEYNENDNLVRDIRYCADGTIWGIEEFDGDGNHVKDIVYQYYADGTLDYYYVSEYDGDGNCVKTTFYNEDGSVKY